MDENEQECSIADTRTWLFGMKIDSETCDANGINNFLCCAVLLVAFNSVRCASVELNTKTIENEAIFINSHFSKPHKHEQ